MQRQDKADDENAFAEAMKDVKPLAPTNLIEQRTPPPSRSAATRQQRVPDEDWMHDETGFSRPGLQHSEFRKLRTGRIPIAGVLDLHGETSAKAEQKLKAFLMAMQSGEGQKAVRVIHGKGLRSPNHMPVLKGKVGEWLRQSNAVLAFCEAGPSDGGSGALRVLLRRR